MRWVLLASFIALPALCQGEQICPWMNAATAGGFLEGSVSSTVVHPKQNSDDATCEFVRQQLPPAHTLRIEVETMTAPSEFSSLAARCGASGTPLKAIGNEAFTCSKHEKAEQRIEEVVGRVRNRAFIIRLTTTDHSIAQASLREKARNVAEQVAGILF